MVHSGIVSQIRTVSRTGGPIFYTSTTSRTRTWYENINMIAWSQEHGMMYRFDWMSASGFEICPGFQPWPNLKQELSKVSTAVCKISNNHQSANIRLQSNAVVGQECIVISEPQIAKCETRYGDPQFVISFTQPLPTLCWKAKNKVYIPTVLPPVFQTS